MTKTGTLTQKGQVVVPKEIRDALNLKPSDKLYFSVDNNKIIAEPIKGLNDMYGILRDIKPASYKVKDVVKKSVIKKFSKKDGSN